jgi:hypothetical protein
MCLLKDFFTEEYLAFMSLELFLAGLGLVGGIYENNLKIKKK